MTLVDFSGYLACSLVLATFIMHDMVALRATAVVSNIAFIVYAYRGAEPETN